MTRVFRFVSIFVILLVATLAVRPTQAADPLRLGQLEIHLQPEYDRADLLVILKGQLPADAALPANVTLHIPASSGGPYAVAVVEDGRLLTAAYTTAQQDDFIAVTLTADTFAFQLEYYEPFPSEEDAWNFTFLWPGDYAVDALIVRLLTPPGAEDVNLDPSLGSPSFDQAGVGYWQAELGPQSAGQPLTIAGSYRRTDTRLTVEALNAAAESQEIEVPAPASLSPSSPGVSWQAGLLALLGVAVLAGGGWRIWRDRRDATAARECSRCGSRARPADQFCTACGGRLSSKDAPSTSRTVARRRPARRRAKRGTRRRKRSKARTPAWVWLGAGVVVLVVIVFLLQPNSTIPLASPEVLAQGQVVYESTCAACHGANGEGDIGSPLNGSAHAWHHVDSQLRLIIRDGIPGTEMPPHGEHLTSDEIDAVISYIKAWWTPEQRAMQRTGRHPMGP